MAGQLWNVASEGGYLYSDELSDTLRQQVQPLAPPLVDRTTPRGVGLPRVEDRRRSGHS